MDQFIDIDGIRTRYRRVGDGPEVLVLHGWGARIEAVSPIVDALARQCTVYAPDLPGFGETEPPPRQPWGNADYESWTRSLMAALGLQRPSIVGHSRGATIAIKLAAEHPDLVDKLILIDAAGIKPRRTWRYRRRVAAAKFAKHGSRLLGAPGRRWRERVIERNASEDYKSAGEMRPTLVRLVNEDITELLPSVRASTLLIWGDRDDATPLRDGQTMERLIPDAGLVVFEGAGHFSYLDERRRFAVVASHFLAPQAQPVA
jgi:pimeloyl-ACP methyl ester carboxylesterase